jgi:hypothetical protein
MRCALLVAMTMAGVTAVIVALTLRGRDIDSAPLQGRAESVQTNHQDGLQRDRAPEQSDEQQHDALSSTPGTKTPLILARSEPFVVDPAALQYKEIPLAEIYASDPPRLDMHKRFPRFNRDWAAIVLMANPWECRYDPDAPFLLPDDPFLLTRDELESFHALREVDIFVCRFHPRDHLLLVAGDDITDAIRAVREVFPRCGEITTVRGGPGKRYWLFAYSIYSSWLKEVISAVVDGRTIRFTIANNPTDSTGAYFNEFWWIPLGELEPGDYRVEWWWVGDEPWTKVDWPYIRNFTVPKIVK